MPNRWASMNGDPLEEWIAVRGVGRETAETVASWYLCRSRDPLPLETCNR